MREANTIHQRRAVRAAQQSRRIRSRLDHRPVATADDPGRTGGVLDDLASGPDADPYRHTLCRGFTPHECDRLFRQSQRGDVARRGASSCSRDLYVFSADRDAEPDPLPDADTAAGDDLVWFEQPYWTVVPVAGAGDGGNGDPDAADLRDPDADVDVHLYGERLIDSRDRWGRERNLT